jgi:Domain amino terminal to FKBP-type peptidyl-prolyl isomerase
MKQAWRKYWLLAIIFTAYGSNTPQEVASYATGVTLAQTWQQEAPFMLNWQWVAAGIRDTMLKQPYRWSLAEQARAITTVMQQQRHEQANVLAWQWRTYPVYAHHMLNMLQAHERHHVIHIITFGNSQTPATHQTITFEHCIQLITEDITQASWETLAHTFASCSPQTAMVPVEGLVPSVQDLVSHLGIHGAGMVVTDAIDGYGKLGAENTIQPNQGFIMYVKRLT